MKKAIFLLAVIIGLLMVFNSHGLIYHGREIQYEPSGENYWLALYRNQNIEHLYLGTPGDARKSKLIKTFHVKSGIPEKSPTPLPTKIGKKYWTIVDKYSSKENPETAPYFLELDVPGGKTDPFGPVPYEECNGQCYWNLPGAFGLHGVNGDLSRLTDKNSGSSGCIRHTDDDISYLYSLIEPEKNIRYYIIDTILPNNTITLKDKINTQDILTAHITDL